jgi:hypothetical protein
MTYVIAGYVLTFGALGLYAGRLVIRSRRVASRVLDRPASEQSSRREPGHDGGH